MNKKRLISILIAVLLTIIVYSMVMAGLTSDVGTLETDPPAGGANWTAWLDKGTVPPNEIMTEDNFNCIDGLDTGYTDEGWLMQVRNFSDPAEADGDTVQMSFGGLGVHSGKHWYYSFAWEGGSTDPTQTVHGEVDLATASGPSCPIIYPAEVEEFDTYKNYTVKFFAQPNTTYLVYRSTTPSGAGNGESNGRYRFRAEVLTDAIGNGIYEDPQDLPLAVNAWYIVFYYDTSGLGQHGCHSEPVDPTSVRMLGFTAEFHGSSVLVEWETAEETDILGFELYRGTSMNFNDSEKLQDVPVADNPGSMEGHSYSYTDDDIEPFTTYYYWVEIIGLDSTRDSIGPASVRTFYELFVPFVLN